MPRLTLPDILEDAGWPDLALTLRQGEPLDRVMETLLDFDPDSNAVRIIDAWLLGQTLAVELPPEVEP